MVGSKFRKVKRSLPAVAQYGTKRQYGGTKRQRFSIGFSHYDTLVNGQDDAHDQTSALWLRVSEDLRSQR